MKNPLLAVFALLALAGVLFAQTSTGAQSMVRALIWIVDTVSVEADIQGQVDANIQGIVPLKDHISVPWTAATLGTTNSFSWVCPEGVHAKLTAIFFPTINYPPHIYQELALGAGTGYWGTATQSSLWNDAVLHPGDTLLIYPQGSPTFQSGILQFAVEYD